MDKDIKTSLECGFDVLGGKWRSRIIVMLSEHEFLRFGEIKNNLQTISDGVLSATLRQLLDTGIIDWCVEAQNPRAKAYYLTPKGKAVLPVFDCMRDWADTWHRPECRQLMEKREETYGN